MQGKQGFAEKRSGQLPCKVLFTAHFQLSIQFQALMEKMVCRELWHFLLDVFFFFLNLAAQKATLCPLTFKCNLGSFLVGFFILADLGLLL